MDGNKVVARQQRQRWGCNNQMKMMFDGGGGRGRSTVVTMENGEAVEHSMVAMWTMARQWCDKTWRQQQNKSKRRMQCWRTRSIGGGTRGWESEANKPNGGRQTSDSHSLVFLPIVLWRGIQQPAREQEGWSKRSLRCVRVWKQGQARGRRMWLLVYGKYDIYVLFMILTWQHVGNERHDTTYDVKKNLESWCLQHVGCVGLTHWDDTEEMSLKLTFEDIKNVDVSS